MSRPVKAYSYIRFSTPKQAQGDSYRRQLQQAMDYCAEHNLQLDDKTIDDFGTSAFRGANMSEGALGRFVDAVKHGEIEQGSYLLVESVDRLSRQAVEEALEQFLAIVRAGIVIVTLSDKQVFRRGQVDFTKLIVSIVYMARANDESEMKSRRSRAAWSNGREQARKNNKVIANSRLPSWLTRDGEQIVPISERVAIVNEMFEMAKSGCGYEQIAKVFLDKGYKTFGKEADWRPAGIQAVIKSQAVIGVFQPHVIENGHRVPADEPILGYYPTIVSPALFEEVQHLISKRNKHSGSYRKGTFNNLFSGVLRCQCGESLRYQNKGRAGSPRNYLVCPKQNTAGCKLPNMLYGKVEPQLLQAVFLLNRVMKQRVEGEDKTIALRTTLAELRVQLEVETQKRKKAAQLVLDNDNDADYRVLFEQCKKKTQALEKQIQRAESDLMSRELSVKTLKYFVDPEDLRSTEQRQRFNGQLKTALKEIRFRFDGGYLWAEYMDIDGGRVLTQIFEDKLAGSSIYDGSSYLVRKTQTEAPYGVDPSVMQQEMDDYIRNLQKNDDGTDPDFEDLSSEYSK
ncbi:MULTISPECIES: recombinase family protein [Aeromonas]|uniref:recombinase family protein n=1 Tax=Aeromonas TaxID=642 RepID=UPI00191E1142|nr:MULTISPECIES: recombinase family protein [Aeromonas]MBL0473254.1 recombinase family protein [Aeromonas veronii]